jgi:glutamine synthetase
LLEAIEAFDADALTHAVFPKEFVSAYVTMKLEEWEAYHSRVSEWERENYLTMF